jgi:hypothetical protein
MARQPTETDPQTAMKALLQERRDVLAERVSVLEKRYAGGTTSVRTVLKAKDQLLDAELQLATTKDQRMVLYRKRRDNLRRLEDFVKKLYEGGQCEFERTLSVTASRLQADIDLLREQMQAAGSDNHGLQPSRK